MEKHQFTKPKPKEGYRRLSLVCGGLGTIIWGFITFMEIIDFGYGRDGKILLGFLFSFFLPWGIVRAIPWVKQGFKEQVFKENENQSTKDEEVTPLHYESFPNEAFPTDTPSHYHPHFSAMGVRLDATEKKLNRIQWGNLFLMCLLVFCLVTIINLITGKLSLKARELTICDRFGNPRIQIYTLYASDKPGINFLNDKKEVVSTIYETGQLVNGPKPLHKYEDLFPSNKRN